MSWRTRRKLIYTTLALLPLFIIAAVIYAVTFFPEPTCSDGIQNQNEKGVDCGGDCVRICQAQTPNVDVVWDRAFQVSNNIYNVAAYIQNPNTTLVAHSVPYTFRLYDQDNIFITEKGGEMMLLPQSRTVAFSAGINTNGRKPGRVVFDFKSDPFWEDVNLSDVELSTSNRRLTTTENPRLSVDITNESIKPLKDIYLAAVVFDQAGEAVHVSRTRINSLNSEETTSATFTWRQPFPDNSQAYRTEIIPTAYSVVD